MTQREIEKAEARKRSLWQQRGLYVKQLRNARGLTQEDLQKKTGLSKATVARVEQGDGDSSYETLHAIGRVLGVRAEDIMVPLKLVEGGKPQTKRTTIRKTGTT